MPNPILFESLPVYGLTQNARIQRYETPIQGIAGVIYEVTAAQAGIEALGHGVMADMTSLQMLAELGNRGPMVEGKPYQGGAVWGRLGHPGMSEDATAKKILRAKNFRVIGDKLVYDAHMLESSRLSPDFANEKPPYEWLFYIAENNPAEVASSIVVYAYFVWTFADREEEIVDTDIFSDYLEERPEDALTQLPVMRPVRFDFVDIVGEGALTYSGMFERAFSGTSSAYLAELFPMLDRFRTQFRIPLDDLPGITGSVLKRYLHSRGYTGEINVSPRTAKGKQPRRGVNLPEKRFDTAPPATQETPPLPPSENDNPPAEEDPFDEILTEARDSESPENDDTDETGETQDDSELETVYEVLNSAMQRIERLESVLAEFGAITNRRLSALENDVQELATEPVIRSKVPPTPRPRLQSGNTGRSFSVTPPDHIVQTTPTSVKNRVAAGAITGSQLSDLETLMSMNPAEVALAFDKVRNARNGN